MLHFGNHVVAYHNENVDKQVPYKKEFYTPTNIVTITVQHDKKQSFQWGNDNKQTPNNANCMQSKRESVCNMQSQKYVIRDIEP